MLFLASSLLLISIILLFYGVLVAVDGDVRWGLLFIGINTLSILTNITTISVLLGG